MRSYIKVQLFVLLVLLVSSVSHAQTNDPTSATGPGAATEPVRTKPIAYPATMPVNYVRVYDLLEPIQSDNTINALNRSQVQVMTKYMDGLGRELQVVNWQATPDGKDMVQSYIYDDYGRRAVQYLPAPTAGTEAGFRRDFFTEQKDFYKGTPSTDGYHEDEDVFYALQQYDNSPLSRVVKAMAPGNSWAGSDVGIVTDYLTNEDLDDVRLWEINGSGLPVSNEEYPIHTLRKLQTTDENGHKVIEFKDKFGRVVLRRVETETTISHPTRHDDYMNTYYVYNAKGQLRFVLPPKAVEQLKTNWTSLNNVDKDALTFEYKYDGRNRMITKRVPGAGEVEMVYDKLNRVVLSQDANQRAANQWSFIKYDLFGRVAFTGLYDEPNASLDTRAELQAAADNWTGAMFVIPDNTTSTQVTGVDISVSSHNAATTAYVAGNSIEFLPGFDSGTSEFEATIIPGTGPVLEGYQDNAFPDLGANAADQLLTINYYNDYSFTTKVFYNGNSTLEQAMAMPTAIHTTDPTAIKGFATGSKVRVLGTNSWLTSVIYYDSRKRIIQTQTDNHLGGEDISTTEYDFAGRAIKVFSKHTNPTSIDNETLTLKTFAYDGQGRMTSSKMRLNGEAVDKTIVSNTYTELGELNVKTLGHVSPGINVETLDYDYNIRGWLKGVNRDKLSTGTSMGTNYFAMDLSYDYGFDDTQLNGNIAGMRWKTKSSVTTRHYGFDYDASNRLSKADYSQTGSGNVSDFSVKNITYDVNGNIQSLDRYGVIAGTNVLLDELTYHYMNSGKSNRLQYVDDGEGNLNQGDFKDLNTGTDDYEYDANGNLTQDKNKEINGANDIKYNHLNLPTEVKFQGDNSKKIVYTYDAAGIKLKKEIIDGANTTTTDYVAGFIYENNELQYFAHEAGRVRKNDGALHYDYFIQDHLGNTRMTLTEETEVTVYRATMETELAGFEESTFLNVAQTRDDGETGVNTTNEPGITNDEYVTLIGNNLNKRVGPGKLIAVSAGDEIDVTVNAIYKDKYVITTPEIGTSDVVTAVSGIFGGVSGGNVEQQAIYDLFNGSSVTNYLDNRVVNTSKPRAYLNYIRFDQDFNYIDASFDQLENAANIHEQLQVSTSFTGQNLNGGYVYVWVSNESDGSTPVYFDDLEITHTKGAILQEDHYYPFGMNMAALSSSAPLAKPNRFKYNGFEEETGFDLGWYDYSARQYDPQTGRFTSLDPAADLMRRHSPYNYAFDNPVRFIDPDGMMPTDAVSALEEWRNTGKEAEEGTAGELVANAWSSTSQGAATSYQTINGELQDGQDLNREITKTTDSSNKPPAVVDLFGPNPMMALLLHFRYVGHGLQGEEYHLKDIVKSLKKPKKKKGFWDFLVAPFKGSFSSSSVGGKAQWVIWSPDGKRERVYDFEWDVTAAYWTGVNSESEWKQNANNRVRGVGHLFDEDGKGKFYTIRLHGPRATDRLAYIKFRDFDGFKAAWKDITGDDW